MTKVEGTPEVRYGELVAGLADIVRQRAGRARRYAETLSSLG